MSNIKYQPLKNNDDETTLHEEDLNNNDCDDQFFNNNNNNKRSYQDCKIYWLLKLLFFCFIIVKIIYVLNNYDTILQWLSIHNETDTNIFRNITYLYDKDTTVASISNDRTSGITKNRESKIRFPSTPIIDNNMYKNITQKLFYEYYTTEREDAGKEETTIITNYYDNVASTTTTQTDFEMNVNEDVKTTTATTTSTIEKNYLNKNKTTTTTTIQYLNQTITSTFKSILKNTTTDLTLVNLTMSSPVPTPLPSDLQTIIDATSTITPRIKDRQKYFINTSNCHIPYIDPFTPEVQKMFKPRHKTDCTTDQAIVSVTFNRLVSQYVLHINYTVAGILRKENRPPIEEDLLCCYQEIVRSGSGSSADKSFKLLSCTNFHQNFTVPLHIKGIIVKCKSKFKKSTLQEDAFSFIQINKTAIQGKTLQNATSAEGRKPSILMIGIDSLSRINFRRNMPKTFKYLMDNNWYELMGYNKVGDNTLPNLMPLLSGYTRTTVYDKCNPKQKIDGFDNCNFIWTTFKKNGYYTAYAEDSTTITTFNYHLKGFQKPPTDHYFRPFALAIEKSLKKKTKSGLNYCVGRRQFGEYVYDYATEFIERYQNLTTFGFFWTNSFSHNSYDIAATMDTNMVDYFKTWENLGIYENSVVVFFSDHGARWGPLLKLSEGFLEERLPMFFMSVPKWFKREYPSLVKNLETNQYRLITPFDINMTLQHLLKLVKPDYPIQQTYDCAKCQTIFDEMPENRTCDDAGIPETWCTCLPFKTVSTKNAQVKTVAHLVIKKINHYFELKNSTSLCSPLKLKEITMAKKRYPNEFADINNLTTYAIDFTTNPLTEPKTLFSATVDYNEENKTIQINVEDISRKSLYKNTAKCTDDKQLKKYCICKNYLKS